MERSALLGGVRSTGGVEVGNAQARRTSRLNNVLTVVSPSPMYSESRGLSDLLTIWRKENGMTGSTTHGRENVKIASESQGDVGDPREDADTTPPQTPPTDPNMAPKVKGGDDDGDEDA